MPWRIYVIFPANLSKCAMEKVEVHLSENSGIPAASTSVRHSIPRRTHMRSRPLARLGALMLAIALVAVPAAAGAGTSRDAPAALTPTNDTAHALAWTGTVGP